MYSANVHIRQTGLIHPDKLQFPISIIGAGGIGSWTTLALTKMGCKNIAVMDFDTVEEHNMGSQIYTNIDIGENKSKALRRHILGLTDTEINRSETKFDKDNFAFDRFSVIISAVDNMEARTQLIQGVDKKPILLIDGRMAGNAIEIYTVRGDNPQDVEDYAKTLFSDDEALPIACSERSVIYNCFVMAGMITDIVAHFANTHEIKPILEIDLANFAMYS